MRNLRSNVLFLVLLAGVLVTIQASAQTPSTFYGLPTVASPPPSSFVMLDNGNQLSKSTVTAIVQAVIPNAPSPEPSCVISSGTCSVNVAITGGGAHECVGMTDSGDTNGPFVVEGAPSPAPSAGVTTGYQFQVTQVTPTSTPTVHIHAVCR